MSGDSVTRALVSATTAIEKAGLRYAIVGGLAVGAWTPPRATRDADMWVEIGEAGDKLYVALVAAGFHVPAMKEELGRFGVFRSKAVDSGVFVDIFDAVGPLGEAVVANRRRCRVGEVDLWYARAEELAVLKAYSERPRDFEDLVALLKHADMDLDILATWAQRLDASIGSDEVSARVAQAVKKARGGR